MLHSPDLSFLNKGSETSLNLLQQWGRFRLGCVRESTTTVHACVRACVVKVAAAVGENQPAGFFEAYVSFHFQKKNLAAANLILPLQGEKGFNQSERLKDR